MKKLLNRFKTKCSKILYQFAFTKNDRRAIGLLSSLVVVSILLRAYGLVRPAREWIVEAAPVFQTAPGTQMSFPETGTHPKSNTNANPPQQTANNNDMKETRLAFATRKDSATGKSTYIPPKYMIKKKFTVDLNIADTFDLQEIYGIGPAFAKRIVRYRKDLGGFVRLAQLREIWGIDSVVFNKITPHLYIQDTNIRKININEADIRILKQHPYLDYYQAKEIYLHRQKYGPFKQVSELKKVNLIDSGTYSRVAPYLCTEQAEH